MHISCPRCNTVVNAKDYDLFQIWECKNCEWRFRGVHANQPHFRNLLNSFIAPYYTNSTVWDLANCPHCSAQIDLHWIGTHTQRPRPFGQYPTIGYNGPYVCQKCCRDLPWDYPVQYPHVAKQFNDEWEQRYGKKPNSSETTPKKEESKESSLNFVEIAERLFRQKNNL